MSLDPFSLFPFAWGMGLYLGNGSPMEGFQYIKSLSRLERNSQLAFIVLMNKFVMQLDGLLRYLNERKSIVGIFVLSEQEKCTIHDSLLKFLSLRVDSLFEIKKVAKRCFFNLFENCFPLLASDDKNEDSPIEIPIDCREFQRLLVLETAIQENISMCVPGFYRCQDIWDKMVKHITNDGCIFRKLDNDAASIELENIYTMWVSQGNIMLAINNLHKTRLEFVNAIIQSYYSLISKSNFDVKFKLLFLPPPFNFIKTKIFNNYYLGKLYFFKHFEASTFCLQQKMKRIKDLNSNRLTCGLRVKFIKFLKKEGTEWIARLEVLENNEKTIVLEPNILKEFILVEDSPEVCNFLPIKFI